MSVFHLTPSTARNLNATDDPWNYLIFQSLNSYLDLLWGQEVPVFFKLTTLYFLIIDLDHVGVIRIDNKSVQVSENIILATDFFLAKQVLSFVVEDDMNLLGAWSTNIRSCK